MQYQDIIDKTMFLLLYLTFKSVNTDESKVVINRKELESGILNIIKDDANAYAFLSNMFSYDDNYNHKVMLEKEFDTLTELSVLKKSVGTTVYKINLSDDEINSILSDPETTFEMLNSTIYVYQKISKVRSR